MNITGNWYLILRTIAAMGAVSVGVVGAIAISTFPLPILVAQGRTTESPHLTHQSLKQNRAALSEEWRLATEDEAHDQWAYILNSPMGIAALNQLAIEGFISPLCPKTLYINDQFGGFQSLMMVECPDRRGASIAVGYDEVHVIFNRFEDNIEGFEIRRFGER
ncbi:MAG: hypothetical protein AAFQ57_06805 [Cyanobacteria bacterium J06626_14]